MLVSLPLCFDDAEEIVGGSNVTNFAAKRWMAI